MKIRTIFFLKLTVKEKMLRDIKFAMCHTNIIKKSTEFRNMDLNNGLHLVAPKEPVYNENFELIIPQHKKIILKSRTICGNYHTIPPDVTPDRETCSENNLPKNLKQNSFECCHGMNHHEFEDTEIDKHTHKDNIILNYRNLKQFNSFEPSHKYS